LETVWGFFVRKRISNPSSFCHQPVIITPHAVKNKERSANMNDYQEELLEIRLEEYDDDEGVNDAVEL
jgi:hypothetical protein